jgi:hypothetical protein
MENSKEELRKKYEWYGYVLKAGRYLNGYIEPSPYIFQRDDAWNQFIESLKIEEHVKRYKEIITEEEDEQFKWQEYIEKNSYMVCLKKDCDKARNKISNSKKKVDGYIFAKNAIYSDQTDRLEYVNRLMEANILRT